MFPGHVRVTTLVQMSFFAFKELFLPPIGKIIFLGWEYNLPSIEGKLYSYDGNIFFLEREEEFIPIMGIKSSSTGGKLLVKSLWYIFGNIIFLIGI